MALVASYSSVGADRLKRCDTERHLGLVWKRDEIEADAAVNSDYVALQLDAWLGHGDAPRGNRILQSDGSFSLDRLRFR